MNKQTKKRNRNSPDGFRQARVRGSVELQNLEGRSEGGLRGSGDDNEDEDSESLMISHTKEVRELRGELNRLRSEFSAVLSRPAQYQQEKASTGPATTDDQRELKDTVDL